MQASTPLLSTNCKSPGQHLGVTGIALLMCEEYISTQPQLLWVQKRGSHEGALKSVSLAEDDILAQHCRILHQPEKSKDPWEHVAYAGRFKSPTPTLFRKQYSVAIARPR